VHSGLLKAAQVTGDASFTSMTRRHFGFFNDTLPYFRAQEQKFKLERGNSFSRFLDPRSLDDSGSMCAALIRARLAKVGPDLKSMIDTCSDWVAKRQFRLEDGTMARLPDLIEFAKEHDLKIGTIADLIHYRSQNECLVERVAERQLSTEHGEFKLVAFRDGPSGAAHLALVHGELAPQEVSLWADDMYMSIPALAEMGRLSGKREHFDDAVNNVLGMSSRMFNPQLGLYTHGWHANNPDAPRFYWGRANGWAVLAMSDLLDVLPKDHPGYPKVLAQLRASLKGIAELQSGSGLWHQMLDRNDSYLEASAGAIFTYVFAHAVNEGWISATTYGSIAQTGWNALTTRINALGQVEGTCVGTTLASDMVYYYHRPTSADALHGYGPMLLAGAEIIRMVSNPAFEIQHKVRTYHYLPKGGQTDYREHH